MSAWVDEDDDAHVREHDEFHARVHRGTLLELALRLVEHRRAAFDAAESELVEAIENARRARQEMLDACEMVERAGRLVAQHDR